MNALFQMENTFHNSYLGPSRMDKKMMNVIRHLGWRRWRRCRGLGQGVGGGGGGTTASWTPHTNSGLSGYTYNIYIDIDR